MQDLTPVTVTAQSRLAGSRDCQGPAAFGRDGYLGGVRPCASANLTSEGTSLTPSFIIRRLR